MSGNVLDIKDVPKSPNTGFGQKTVYNPLPEDFIHSFNGTPYTIKAGTSEGFPEFLAYHLAKHLAQKIVSRKWEFQIKKDAVGQITPDTAKAIPLIEVQQTMEALMLGKDAFEKVEIPESQTQVPIAETKPEPTPVETKSEPTVGLNPLKCGKCDFVAKSKFGLQSHQKKHK